jgi:glycosyltransferase
MRFSIITAVWNRRATIGDALASLAAQSYGDYEHLVQDGGSADGTLDLLRGIDDPRLRLASGPDGGIYDALNRAFARSSGEVIGLLHSDDFFAHPHVLRDVAALFESSGADAVYGDLDYVSAADPTRVVRHWVSGDYAPGRLKRGWMPPHPALFLRRAVIERWGGYDTSFRIAADYDSILRYFGKGGISAAYLPQVLTRMRVGGESNASLRKILRKSREDYRALRQNEVGGLGALAWKNLSKLGQFVAR